MPANALRCPVTFRFLWPDESAIHHLNPCSRRECLLGFRVLPLLFSEVAQSVNTRRSLAYVCIYQKPFIYLFLSFSNISIRRQASTVHSVFNRNQVKFCSCDQSILLPFCVCLTIRCHSCVRHYGGVHKKCNYICTRLYCCHFNLSCSALSCDLPSRCANHSPASAPRDKEWPGKVDAALKRLRPLSALLRETRVCGWNTGVRSLLRQVA